MSGVFYSTPAIVPPGSMLGQSVEIGARHALDVADAAAAIQYNTVSANANAPGDSRVSLTSSLSDTGTSRSRSILLPLRRGQRKQRQW